MDLYVLVTGSRRDHRLTRAAAGLEMVWSAAGMPHPKKFANIYLVHGDADGMDTACKTVCEPWGWIPIPFPCTKEDWARYPKYAGNKRNGDMVKFILDTIQPGDFRICCAFPCPKSRGTWDCVQQAFNADFPIQVTPYLMPPSSNQPLQGLLC